MSALSPFQAQAKLASLPASPEAVNYLMSLVNGANSEIPRYMALGRLEQMKQEMASNKPAQPPQGTVKDKIQQSVGIMALRGGQQQQAAQQMAQGAPQGMPVPANVPQPQTQPQSEEEQMPEMDVETAAGGGLMQARIDPRMFDFAPGGIVSFAGDTGSRVELGKEKPLTKEEREKLENELRMRKIGAEYRQAVDARAQALAEERAAAAAQEPSPAPTVAAAQEPRSAPAAAPAAPRDSSDVETPIGMAKPPARPDIAGGIGKFLSSVVSRPTPKPMRFDEAPDTTAPSPTAGPATPVAAPPPPPPVAAAPAAAAPRPPVAPGAPRPPAAPAAAAPGLDQGVGALAQKLTPEVDESKVRAAYGRGEPVVRSIEQIAADQNKIYDLTGVGTYGKERRKQIANMRQEFEQSRPSTSEDVIDMIRAGIRPGAIAGAAGEYSSQLKREREARLSFSKAEDALKDAVEKADEAVRSGKATDIVRARDEERKAQADYKKAEVELEKSIMTSKATASGQGLMAATQLTTTGMSNLTSLQVAKIQAAATRAGLTKPSESERVGAEYRRILGAGGQKAADAFLADEAKVRAAVGGVKYEGPDTSTRDSKAIQDAISKRTTMIDTQLQSGNLKPDKEAELLARRKKIADQVRKEMGAEGGGQFSVSAPDGKTYQFNSQAEADAFKQRIGG